MASQHPTQRPTSKSVTLQSRIPNDAHGRSLLDYLTSRFRYHSRDAWRSQIEAARIRLDDAPAAADTVLRRGMVLRYDKQHREPAVDPAFAVLARDEALLAVHKPAHLPMHADGPFLRNTLIHLLREQCGDELQLVHRLDRETSGICIVATSKQTQALIQEQFRPAQSGPADDPEPRVRKTYCAIVHGQLHEPIDCQEAIGHHAQSSVKLRRSAAPDAIAAKPAATRVEPIRHGPDKTLVRCVPRTGRTHQIRVHLEHHGYPIVGDKLYGQRDQHYLDFVHRMKAGYSVFDEQPGQPNRHLLHAHEIEFLHPTKARRTAYRSPLPPEFERWLLS